MPASELASKHVGRPLPNAALLGAFAALCGLITLDAVQAAIRSRFAGAVALRNIAAAAEAWRIVTEEERLTEASHA